MQQAIRALGWATKLLGIVLIFLAITIAYSATQIDISFGQPTTIPTEQTLTISLPISIHNAGLYGISQLNITTRITDTNGTLAQNSTLTQAIAKGANTIIAQTMTLSISGILAKQNNLLLDDTNLTEFQYVAFEYANAISLNAHGNYTQRWGAPLGNLSIGNPSYQHYNSTYSMLSVQISFQNHNQYIPVTGNVSVEIYNLRDTLKGTGVVGIDAQPNTSYSTQVNILVSNFGTVDPQGTINVFFETSMFNYGPVVKTFE